MRFMRFKPMRTDNVSIRTKLWVLVGVGGAHRGVDDHAVHVAARECGPCGRGSGGRGVRDEGLELVRNLQLHRDHEMRVLRGNTASQASLDQTAVAVAANSRSCATRPRGRREG
jgi:hypothetical protein